MPGTILLKDLHDRANEFSDWVGQLHAPPPPAPPAPPPPPMVNPVQPALDTLGQAKDSFLNWADQQHAQEQPAPVAAPTPSDSLTNPLGAAPAPTPTAVPEPPSDFLQWVDQGAKPVNDWLTQRGQDVGAAVQTAQTAFHDPSPPIQTPGTRIANAPNQSGQVFPLASAPSNKPNQTYHLEGGSDLMAPRGTPVLSMQGGTVQSVYTDNGDHQVGGNGVLIHGDDGLDYYYAHFDQPPGLKAGQRVSAGDQIGAVGNSGNAWKGGQGETHLHIGIGHGISNGVGAEGGLGQGFNAQALLTELQGGLGQGTSTTQARPMARTTAELSGGGPSTGGLTDRAQGIMGEAAQAASWLGDQGEKALQAILVTEGGMNNARGDNGQSAGPLQFYEGGQLANFAKQAGMGLEQAKSWVEQNPGAAVAWAIGTPDKPGYLGGAIQRGLQQGLSGADLATYAQRTGQVSVSPERAGQNYAALFGGAGELLGRATQAGQDLVRQTQETLAATGAARPTPTTTDQQMASFPSRSILEDTRSSGFRAPDEVLNPGGIVSSAQQWLQDRGQDFTAPLAGVQSPQTGNPLLDTLGTGTSVLGTGAQALATGVRNITPTSELARGVLGQEQLVAENRALFDQQQRLVDEFAGAQARGDEVAMADIRARMDTLQAQLPNARDRDVLQQAAERNPSLGLVETGANLAGAALAAPLAAQGAPVAARALATAIDPLTGLPSLGRRAGAIGEGLDLGGKQEAQASVSGALNLGGAVAGGAAGNATTPEDASPLERAARIGTGAALGFGAAGAAGAVPGAVSRPLEQQVLESLHAAGLVAGPGRAQTAQGAIPTAVDVTKQMMLSNPATHIANIIGNTIELARQPAALALGGRGEDAMASSAAVWKALPDAASNALSALQGRQLPTLAGEGSAIPARSPIFRGLSASDAFTRTLGEYQGMAAEANRLLREGGLAPNDPTAASFLAGHAAELYEAGARSGAQSVFGRINNVAEGRSALDNIFRTYGNAKDDLLQSPRVRDQAMGALMDFAIPFSGIPVRLVEVGLNRLPITAQTSGAVRAVRALRAGDVGAAQRAVGETGLETVIQLAIAKNVAEGNITGPDDPSHPNSVRVAGTWVSMNEWGAYGLPMQIMASFADGYEKGGRDVPAGAPFLEAYGARGAAALNASLKPFQKGIPGENLVRLLANLGQGGATGAALGVAQDAISRITVPGAARFIENAVDPVARDINRKGVQSLWEGTMAAWPGLANRLPERIDPTTGEPLAKLRSGPGILVGAQQEVESPITQEANRLHKEGFKITPPKDYPDSITIGGAEVKLSPDEQRRVTEITGKTLGDLAPRLDQPDYQNASDERKAQLMQAYLNAAERARVAAVRDVIGADELRARLLANQRTVGRLNAPGSP